MGRKKGSTGQRLDLAEARAQGSASSRIRVALWCGNALWEEDHRLQGVLSSCTASYTGMILLVFVG